MKSRAGNMVRKVFLLLMQRLLQCRLLRVGVACFLLGIISVCTSLRPGSGTETTTGIVGTLINDQGRPQPHTQVHLLPSDFNPGIDNTVHPSDTTDSLGNFYFTSIDPGKYSVEAVQLDSRNRAIISDVYAQQDTVTMCAGIMHLSGTVKIEAPQSTGNPTAYVYIPGTLHIRRIDDIRNNFFVLDSVPAGFIPAIKYAAAKTSMPEIIRYGIDLTPGDSVVVMNPGWKYVKYIVLNTSETGAHITNSLLNFPVLIRLSAENFHFADAQLDGSDIRFTKNDSKPLPFEIARWDNLKEQAEVWVKVDTVRGDDSLQNIVMYYGNSSAINVSKSSEVFDSTNGFAGVWHLDGTCTDASSNNHDGTNYGTSDTVGMIGLAKKFSGKDSIKISGLMGMPEIVTLSAWAQLDSTLPGSGSEIVTIGDATLLRMDYTVANFGTMGAIHLTQDSAFFNVSSGQFLKQAGWHYVAFSFNQTTFTGTLYIDGVKIGSRTDQNVPIIYSGVGQSTYIGKHGNGKPTFNFIGKIDEVRVCAVERSADWIKLCYMNQRNDDRLVNFK